MSKRFGKKRVPDCRCTHNFTCGPCMVAAGPTRSAAPAIPLDCKVMSPEDVIIRVRRMSRAASKLAYESDSRDCATINWREDNKPARGASAADPVVEQLKRKIRAAVAAGWSSDSYAVY